MVMNKVTASDIQFEPTSGYSPQENGCAERKIRTLTEMMQAMLSDAGMNRKWWGECLLQATYNTNITQSAGGASAWELFKGSIPSIDTLYTFDCTAWVHIPDELRGSKAMFPTEKVCGCYLGYDFPNFHSHQVPLPLTPGMGQFRPWQSRHDMFDESKPAISQVISHDVANRASLPAAVDLILMPAIVPPAPLSSAPEMIPPSRGVSSAVQLSAPATVPAPAATPVHQRAHHNPLYSDGALPTIYEEKRLL
jgi:hypothetical protein